VVQTKMIHENCGELIDVGELQNGDHIAMKYLGSFSPRLSSPSIGNPFLTPLLPSSSPMSKSAVRPSEPLCLPKSATIVLRAENQVSEKFHPRQFGQNNCLDLVRGHEFSTFHLIPPGSKPVQPRELPSLKRSTLASIGLRS
jgi:hypothetical protein